MDIYPDRGFQRLIWEIILIYMWKHKGRLEMNLILLFNKMMKTEAINIGVPR